jgi:hypothetical protein
MFNYQSYVEYDIKLIFFHSVQPSAGSEKKHQTKDRWLVRPITLFRGSDRLGWNISGMMTNRRIQKHSEKNLASISISNANPIWTALGMNFELCGENLAPVRMAYDAWQIIRCIFHKNAPIPPIC